MVKEKIRGLLVGMGASCVLLACGSNSNNTSTAPAGSGTATDTSTAAAAPAAPATLGNGISKADYDKGLALVAQSDCFSCHNIEQKLVGPAYKDVANKYTADPAVIDSLANKVIKGGKGVWGEVPMTPHPQLSKDDARQMVKYVLSLK